MTEAEDLGCITRECTGCKRFLLLPFFGLNKTTMLRVKQCIPCYTGSKKGQVKAAAIAVVTAEKPANRDFVPDRLMSVDDFDQRSMITCLAAVPLAIFAGVFFQINYLTFSPRATAAIGEQTFDAFISSAGFKLGAIQESRTTAVGNDGRFDSTVRAYGKLVYYSYPILTSIFFLQERSPCQCQHATVRCHRL